MPEPKKSIPKSGDLVRLDIDPRKVRKMYEEKTYRVKAGHVILVESIPVERKPAFYSVEHVRSRQRTVDHGKPRPWDVSAQTPRVRGRSSPLVPSPLSPPPPMDDDDPTLPDQLETLAEDARDLAHAIRTGDMPRSQAQQHGHQLRETLGVALILAERLNRQQGNAQMVVINEQPDGIGEVCYEISVDPTSVAK